MRTQPPPIRMIATDIDGTMLLPDGSLSANVRDALHEAVAAGIHVVPATGRPMMVATDVLDALGLDDYWIFANGAVTWHHGRAETVRGYWMAPEAAMSFVERIRAQLPNCSLAVEFESTAVFELGFERVFPLIVNETDCVEDVRGVVHEPVQKILVVDPSKTVEELFGEVSLALGEDAVPSFSGLAFIEVAAELVTKGVAVAGLAEDLGIDRSEVATFGDHHNDVSMLEWAGRGYAMGNGTDDAKAAADFVIGTNAEDALATQVRSLIAEHR